MTDTPIQYNATEYNINRQAAFGQESAGKPDKHPTCVPLLVCVYLYYSWRKDMKLNYTYWKEDGWLIGYLDEFPGWWTQGKDIPEFESMLIDLYDLCDDEESMLSAKKTDNEIPVNVLHGCLKIPLVVTA
jgi:predicted RNase H-like HicB family nuclease